MCDDATRCSRATFTPLRGERQEAHAAEEVAEEPVLLHAHQPGRRRRAQPAPGLGIYVQQKIAQEKTGCRLVVLRGSGRVGKTLPAWCVCVTTPPQRTYFYIQPSDTGDWGGGVAALCTRGLSPREAPVAIVYPEAVANAAVLWCWL